MAGNCDAQPTPNAVDGERGPADREGFLRRLSRHLRENKLSWPVRLAFLYAGVALPIICHLMTIDEPPDAANWQSGSLDDKLSFTLSGRVGFVFYPLMLYPITCLSMLLFRERRYADNAIVRFGIYTGIPVAVWYVAMLGIVVTDVSGPLSWDWLGTLVMGAVAIGVPLAVWGLIRLALWARRKLGIPWIGVAAGVVVLYALATLFAVLADGDPLGAAFWPVGVVMAFCIVSLAFGPSWALGVYLGMTLRLLWCYPHPLRYRTIQLMAAMSWLAAFMSACRWSIVKSLEEYARLPMEPTGGCYVVSAAAYGHPRLVGSQVRTTSVGATVPVNNQLRTLKAGELALRVLSPRGHRLARCVYDRLGPLAARRLANPYLADLVYVALKPAEWSSFLILAWFLGRHRNAIDRLYPTTRPAPRLD